MRAAGKILLILCLMLSKTVNAQNKPAIKKQKFTIGNPFLDSMLKRGRPLISRSVKSSQFHSIVTSTCNTSTFYMHLPALSGQGLELKSIQTLPEGNFIAAINNILANNERMATIVKISNDGTILKQQQILINNKSFAANDMRVMIDGSILIGGVENEDPANVVILKLKSDLSTEWVKEFKMRSAAVSVKVDLISEDLATNPQQILIAVQLSTSVVCIKFKADNTVQWSSEFDVNDINELVGFSYVYPNLALVVNVSRGGRKQTTVTGISEIDGSILESSLIGNGADETKCFDSRSFYRLNLVSVRKTGSAYRLERDKMYASSSIETQHLYSAPGSIDLDISGAMDNASDALGFCLPKDGKLIFIRHYSDYNTSPDFTREYTVPVNASIKGIARSYDGGYLFSLNTASAKEVILIKTDSTGVLSGCNYSSIQATYTETIGLKNTPENSSANLVSLTQNIAGLTFSNTSYKESFDCNQNYCPAPPSEDSCLNTYYKILNSNSYIDLFTNYCLMQNSTQLALTTRYDRVMAAGNIVSAGLKRYDEKGNFLNGVNMVSDDKTFGHVIRRMDDDQILVRSYSSDLNQPHFTFTLMNSSLGVIWQKSVDLVTPYGIGGDPNTEDWCKDQQGNFYYVATEPGFFGKPSVFIYKMDANGDKVWVKGYQFNQGYFETVKITPTVSSVVIVIDGFDKGCVSIAIDKQTGNIKNSYSFNNEFSGSLYERVLKKDGNHIFYSGSTENDYLLMALFDTTGKPLKMKVFKDYNTIPRAGNVKNGKLFLTFDAYNNGRYNDAIVKVDSALNVEYMHEYYDGRYILATGLGIDDNGSVFVGGNWFNNYYANPFIKKYDNLGLLGICSYTEVEPVLLDLDPEVQPIAPTSFAADVVPINIGFDILPDNNGHTIGSILCSSVVQCNSIKIAGPNNICRLDTAYTYKAQKNLNCTLSPVWEYDTTFATPKSITDTSLVLNFKKAGQTWLKVKLYTGCSYYMDSLLVQIKEPVETFSLGNDTVLCPTDSLVLNAGTSFNNYQWQDGSTDTFFTVKTPGIYFVHANNVCGSKYADTIKITGAVIPYLNIGGDTTLCINDTIKLMAPPVFKTYNWQPQSMVVGQGATVYSIPKKSQQFILNATTVDGCKTADSLFVNIIAPRAVNLGDDVSFCDYDSITLNAGNGYLSYQWNTGETSPSVTVKTNGLFTVSAMDVNKCFARDTIMINVLQHPSFNLGADMSLCVGTSLNLDPGVYKSYLWYDGTTNRILTVNQPGKYSVTVTDNNNCVGQDSINIISLLPLPANFLNATDSICQYDKLEIQPQQSFITYSWSTGSVQPSIFTETPGIYTLTVKDINGCIGTDTINVIAKTCMFGLYIPTAFTPNADRRNDVFRAKVFGNALSFRMQVYNRFGQMIFNSADPYKGWDGTFNGKLADAGTYVWQCSYQLEGDKPSYRKGTVVLIR